MERYKITSYESVRLVKKRLPLSVTKVAKGIAQNLNSRLEDPRNGFPNYKKRLLAITKQFAQKLGKI